MTKRLLNTYQKNTDTLFCSKCSKKFKLRKNDIQIKPLIEAVTMNLYRKLIIALPITIMLLMWAYYLWAYYLIERIPK